MRAHGSVAIAVLLPDVLGTYSDAGNAVVLAQRLRWRGVAAEIVDVTAGTVPPTGCDLYVIGGGEDTAEYVAADWLARHDGLRTALAERAVSLAVCAGLQIFGRVMTDRAGVEHAGLGLLDLVSSPGARRTVGESVSVSTLPGVGRVTGFHNHGGVTLLGPDALPFAHTERGPGNHPGTRVEGAVSRPTADAATGPGIVATYLHGPVLARNPALADHLLARALGAPLPPLDPDRLPDMAALRATYLG
ncbi:glutamine amidotransferase [Actinomycetospora endophytica]|uniref:Lipid II isoglutaminyl synthase (glutamine-hydrolyzing) subunit GatD n=1 Tax=Actinomycetospora endophytica TaxID=2291215 RepID=A0ABS8PBA9_9PSEU|nr:glutamine amidotransferase [Actinomycetospora endophytica]MCD2195202.1 glutamine amidotransferase [Actinomycetospora endophytica]